MTKEEIINAIIERAAEEPSETLRWMTGTTVAIAETIVAMNGEDKSKRIELSTNQRNITIHAKPKATLPA